MSAQSKQASPLGKGGSLGELQLTWATLGFLAIEDKLTISGEKVCIIIVSLTIVRDFIVSMEEFLDLRVSDSIRNVVWKSSRHDGKLTSMLYDGSTNQELC